MATRLEILQQRLDDYEKAEGAVLNGAQEYRIGTRLFKRGDLQVISDMIKYLEKEIAAEQSKLTGNGRNRTLRVIPRDF